MKSKMFKLVISYFIITALLLSQVNWPATASAASGTLVMITAENAQQYNLSEDYVDYYAIADADDLLAFSALVNAKNGNINGVLISDIDMTGKTYVPIGYSRDITFGGYFEGKIGRAHV